MPAHPVVARRRRSPISSSGDERPVAVPAKATNTADLAGNRLTPLAIDSGPPPRGRRTRPAHGTAPPQSIARGGHGHAEPSGAGGAPRRRVRTREMSAVAAPDFRLPGWSMSRTESEWWMRLCRAWRGDHTAFLVGIFPAWLRDGDHGADRVRQVPVDLYHDLLSVLAAAAGEVVVEIRGSWREPSTWWRLRRLLLPGSRKSAVFAELTGPGREHRARDGQDAWARITEADNSGWSPIAGPLMPASWAGRADDDNKTAEAISAAMLAEATTVPGDAAPDRRRAATLLAEQGGRLAVLSAEGGCFTLSGRYSNTPNLEVFLKGHLATCCASTARLPPPEHIAWPGPDSGLAIQRRRPSATSRRCRDSAAGAAPPGSCTPAAQHGRHADIRTDLIPWRHPGRPRGEPPRPGAHPAEWKTRPSSSSP